MFVSVQRLYLTDNFLDEAAKAYLIHFVARLKGWVKLDITWMLSLIPPGNPQNPCPSKGLAAKVGSAGSGRR